VIAVRRLFRASSNSTCFAPSRPSARRANGERSACSCADTCRPLAMPAQTPVCAWPHIPRPASCRPKQSPPSLRPYPTQSGVFLFSDTRRSASCRISSRSQTERLQQSPGACHAPPLGFALSACGQLSTTRLPAEAHVQWLRRQFTSPHWSWALKHELTLWPARLRDADEFPGQLLPPDPR